MHEMHYCAGAGFSPRARVAVFHVCVRLQVWKVRRAFRICCLTANRDSDIPE